MLRNKIFSLPENWEDALEQMMLKRPIGIRRERVYICSPCRSDSAEGVARNMRAAKMYMYCAYVNFAGVPKAPHAYLPILLNDNYEDERTLALHIGVRFLESCDRLFVCGNRLSEGMYGEIAEAAKRAVPILVFNRKVRNELRDRLARNGLDPETVCHEKRPFCHALAWGADRLETYTEKKPKPVLKPV
jgi:hypothetical protein